MTNIPTNLEEALLIAPLAYPHYPNLEFEGYFQPYSIAHLLTRMDGKVDNRWESNIEQRRLRGFSSCDLWNFDWFASYLVAYTAKLLADKKVIPTKDKEAVTAWVTGFDAKVVTIGISENESTVHDLIMGEFVEFILPALPFIPGGNYEVQNLARNTGLNEQDYEFLGSHLIHVLKSGMRKFMEIDVTLNPHLHEAIAVLESIESGNTPTPEEVRAVVDILPSCWI